MRELQRLRKVLSTVPGRGSATRRRPERPARKMSADGCAICGCTRTAYQPVAFWQDPTKSREVSRCSGCGYLAIRELVTDRYRGKTSIDQLPGAGLRIGTVDRRGREYRMARMALDILGRARVSVLVYGIGRSLDNRHIAELPRVSAVAIGDIVKVRDDAEFHDANLPATKQFDVVIASEVVEHFREPREDFAKLFQFLAPDGLLVCGTNIYDGGDLTRDGYIYFPDHTSYYTPESLLEIAREHGCYLDFRTPRLAKGTGRKRYVLFTRSPEVLQRTALYFGRRAVAPSE